MTKGHILQHADGYFVYIPRPGGARVISTRNGTDRPYVELTATEIGKLERDTGIAWITHTPGNYKLIRRVNVPPAVFYHPESDATQRFTQGWLDKILSKD